MTDKTKRKTVPITRWQMAKLVLFAAGCLFVPYLSIYIHSILNSQIYLSSPLNTIANALLIITGIGASIFTWLILAIRGEHLWERAGAKSVFVYLMIATLSLPGLILFTVGVAFTTTSVNEMTSRVVIDEHVYYIVDSYGMMTDFYKDVYECLPGEMVCLHVDSIAWDERESTPEEIVQIVLDRTGR